MRPFIALLLAAALLGASPASASLFCPVMQTRDGFVALRDKPSMEGKVVARMKSDDEIMLTNEEENGWIKVLYWTGDTRLSKGYGTHRSGWMHRRFVPKDECG